MIGFKPAQALRLRFHVHRAALDGPDEGTVPGGPR